MDRESAQWWVSVGSGVYGPYDTARVRDFIAEGRVRHATRVARSRDDVCWSPAAFVAEFIDLFPAAPEPEREAPSPGPANVLVYAEFHSAAAMRLETTLSGIGRTARLAPNLYALRTKESVVAVRSALARIAFPGDRFLILDATRNRHAWCNLGPEAEARLRDIWSETAA